MALKDWKKKKTNALARWDKGTDVMLIYNVRGGGYQVEVSKSVGSPVDLGVVKTKTQALKIARTHMRTH